MKLSEYLDADWGRLMDAQGTPGRPRRFASCLSPRFAPVVLLRCAQTLHCKGYQRLAKLCSLALFILFGMEVPAQLDIGPGLLVPHTQGIVLGAARIGRNVTIFHQVTLGAKSADFGYDLSLRPVLGDGVTVSVGAVVLGGVHLGDGCLVGANAVVVSDVPSGVTVAGVPARVIQRNTEELS